MLMLIRTRRVPGRERSPSACPEVNSWPTAPVARVRARAAVDARPDCLSSKQSVVRTISSFARSHSARSRPPVLQNRRCRPAFADLSATMIYTHVLNRGALGVRSPTDRL
jgi:hypothetical protein